MEFGSFAFFKDYFKTKSRLKNIEVMALTTRDNVTGIIQKVEKIMLDFTNLVNQVQSTQGVEDSAVAAFTALYAVVGDLNTTLTNMKSQNVLDEAQAAEFQAKIDSLSSTLGNGAASLAAAIAANPSNSVTGPTGPTVNDSTGATAPTDDSVTAPTAPTADDTSVTGPTAGDTPTDGSVTAS